MEDAAEDEGAAREEELSSEASLLGDRGDERQ
jgi:hypothetical protein